MAAAMGMPSLAAGVLCLAPTLAWATSQSVVALGAGAGVGRVSADGGVAELVELTARAWVLRVVGGELEYRLGQDAAVEPALRASALLRILPTYPIGLYLKAGVSAASLGELRGVLRVEPPYHVGAGLEVFAGRHLVVSGEYLSGLGGLESVVGAARAGESVRNAATETHHRLVLHALYYL